MQSAWVLPVDGQTAETGTLANFLIPLGAEVEEVDLDEDEDEDDDDVSPNANGLIDLGEEAMNDIEFKQFD